MAVGPGRRTAGRDYPPLLLASLVMLGLLVVMPSALDLPQSTPTETVEYAPVPPDDQVDVPPPAGNFSSLGLGSSSGLSPEPLPDVEPDGGQGRQVKLPGSKRCVGSPPRQTEDPLAPPCVGFFQGDNGGATYQGVTREEVRVLVMVAGYSSTGNYRGGNEDQPYGTYYDLAEPAKESEHSSTRYLRAWQRYFNERYQTYGRFVHFFAYYPKLATHPEARRAEAAENYEKVRPFAVVWPTTVAGIPEYNEVAASKGVLTFSGLFGLRAGIFRQYPKLAWGYLPSLEEHATNFSAFACEKVAPHPVSFSGIATDRGRPRRYGLIYTTAAALPLSKEFVKLVRPQLSRCGIDFAEEATHPFTGRQVDSRTGPEYAAEAMARFQGSGITTIIWMFGYETNFSKAAAAINYRPEWILAGDGLSESVWNGQGQEQSVWDHAMAFTLHTKTAFGGVSEPCRDAYLQVDPDIPRGTLDMAITCFFYDELRQLFTGIQVAGPKLTPTSLDRGFHAIPPIPSRDPAVPSCYYKPGDYTCVKDGTLFWYDAEYQDENTANTAGCWRLAGGGRRYLPGGWPAGNLDAQNTPQDPCNGALGGLQVG